MTTREQLDLAQKAVAALKTVQDYEDKLARARIRYQEVAAQMLAASQFREPEADEKDGAVAEAIITPENEPEAREHLEKKFPDPAPTPPTATSEKAPKRVTKKSSEKGPELYNANADDEFTAVNSQFAGISDAQIRMIFGGFNRKGVKDPAVQKMIIQGYIADNHQTKIESTKDISMAWATGLIDFIEKSTAQQMLEKYEMPF